MAIDTAQKRASAVAMATMTPNLFPDGAIGDVDKQHTALVYSGITAQTLTAATGGGITYTHNWLFDV